MDQTFLFQGATELGQKQQGQIVGGMSWLGSEGGSDNMSGAFREITAAYGLLSLPSLVVSIAEAFQWGKGSIPHRLWSMSPLPGGTRTFFSPRPCESDQRVSALISCQKKNPFPAWDSGLQRNSSSCSLSSSYLPAWALAAIFNLFHMFFLLLVSQAAFSPRLDWCPAPRVTWVYIT